MVFEGIDRGAQAIEERSVRHEVVRFSNSTDVGANRSNVVGPSWAGGGFDRVPAELSDE